ncbi:MAG: anhydro-N-acetylmuramic acid kinase [Enterobacterales bacterium]|nr:anhydro-N-acetylmuramic acid kinase [Enterobacterales bacterium]
MSEIYIGIMSGTSLDGIDVSVVQFENSSFNILYSDTFNFEPELHRQLKELVHSAKTGLQQLGEIQHRLANNYALAVKKVLHALEINAHAIKAIGCHGQTVYHQPDGEYPYSLQLGSGAILAELTSIPVVTDFRNNDIALGGQGAPLVPRFHASLVRSEDLVAIINLGGIANISLIEKSSVTGFDTGPANCLLDRWYRKWHTDGFDVSGNWASTGKVNAVLLQAMLSDNYFSEQPPKSTGTEYFNSSWLNKYLSQLSTQAAPEDVQATLIELTAQTVKNAIPQMPSDKVYFCGGGVQNKNLMRALRDLLGEDIKTTDALGIAPDYMEAVAFAWLARSRLRSEPATFASVTGAKSDAISGCVYLPSL